MAKAKKLPSGKWRVQAKRTVFGNHEIKSFTANTKTAAETAAILWQKEQTPISIANMTLAEAYDRYINSKSSILSPNTLREYKREKQRSFQNIMNINISSLNNEIVQASVNIEAASHSPKTVRNSYGLLSSVLNMFAPNLKLIIQLPQNKPTEMIMPEEDDVKKLLKSVKGTEMELPILLAALGPMRRGEICALTDRDVKGNIITVNKALALNEEREWVEKSPKTTSSYRSIEYPDSVINLLKGKKGRLVELSPNAITKRFNQILKANGIEPFRFHDLRHYNVSILHAMNIPDKYIMARGGWSTNYTMNKFYRHILQKEQDKNTEKILNYFNEFGA